MPDLSGPLLAEFQRLEQAFTISKDKLKEVTARFREELQEGLDADHQNLV